MFGFLRGTRKIDLLDFAAASQSFKLMVNSTEPKIGGMGLSQPSPEFGK